MAELNGDNHEAWGRTAEPRIESVDERLRRLEAAVAVLQNGTPAEEQVAERVMARLALAEPAGESSGGLSLMLPSLAAQAADAAAAGKFRPFKEVRLMARMYVDPRYRLSRVAQFGVPIVLSLMVLNYLLFAFWSLPLLSLVFPFVERLVLIVLAVALYKLLSREAARYEAVLAYLSRYGR
jgi:hypothetical protein